MISVERRVRVALWLAYMHSLESEDAVRRGEWPEAEAAGAASEAAYDCAIQLSGGALVDTDWQEAVASFGEAPELELDTQREAA